MKPNQRGRFNGRYNNNNSNRGARPQTIFRNTSLESTGPCGKLHGTALQLFEKYQAAAKDALIQNDDVLAETCLQYADHYMHIQNTAIANEQAFRQQQQAQRQPVVVEADTVASPEKAVEENATATSEKEEVPTDGALKVLDLSVPVADMAANHAPDKRATLTPRRRGPAKRVADSAVLVEE